jgi:hypothetical protein
VSPGASQVLVGTQAPSTLDEPCLASAQLKHPGDGSVPTALGPVSWTVTLSPDSLMSTHVLKGIPGKS